MPMIRDREHKPSERGDGSPLPWPRALTRRQVRRHQRFTRVRRYASEPPATVPDATVRVRVPVSPRVPVRPKVPVRVNRPVTCACVRSSRGAVLLRLERQASSCPTICSAVTPSNSASGSSTRRCASTAIATANVVGHRMGRPARAPMPSPHAAARARRARWHRDGLLPHCGWPRPAW